MFEFQSRAFTTKAECNQYLQQCKKEMCDYFNIDRADIKLPHGIIVLQCSAEKKWYSLTSSIGDFNKHIDCDLWERYRIISKVKGKQYV